MQQLWARVDQSKGRTVAGRYDLPLEVVDDHQTVELAMPVRRPWPNCAEGSPIVLEMTSPAADVPYLQADPPK